MIIIRNCDKSLIYNNDTIDCDTYNIDQHKQIFLENGGAVSHIFHIPENIYYFFQSFSFDLLTKLNNLPIYLSIDSIIIYKPDVNIRSFR